MRQKLNSKFVLGMVLLIVFPTIVSATYYEHSTCGACSEESLTKFSWGSSSYDECNDDVSAQIKLYNGFYRIYGDRSYNDDYCDETYWGTDDDYEKQSCLLFPGDLRTDATCGEDRNRRLNPFLKNTVYMTSKTNECKNDVLSDFCFDGDGGTQLREIFYTCDGHNDNFGFVDIDCTNFKGITDDSWRCYDGACVDIDNNVDLCLQQNGGSVTSGAFVINDGTGKSNCCFQSSDSFGSATKTSSATLFYLGEKTQLQGWCDHGNWVGQNEICNNKDDDYDGIVDNNCDNDGDGFVAYGTMCSGNFLSHDGNVYSCEGHSGDYWGDCNDNDGSINPYAPEVCDAIDNNCNGIIDASDPTKETLSDRPYNSIQDGVCDYSLQQCVNGKYEEWFSTGNTKESPNMNYYSENTASDGGETICDGYDNDCDGLIDEGCDSDLDGYIDITRKPRIDQNTCLTYAGSTRKPQCTDDQGNSAETCNGCVQGKYDYNDNNPEMYPGKPEICNGKDDNGVGFCREDPEKPCDSDSNGCSCITIDEGCDMDGDGFLAEGLTCEGSFTNFYGYIEPCSEKVDCDDTNAEHRPDRTWYKDADQDNYYAMGTISSCKRQQGYNEDEWFYYTDTPSYEGVDCDDGNANVNPGQPEVCDGIDNNCDQFHLIDENWFTQMERPLNIEKTKGVCAETKQQCKDGAWTDWYGGAIFVKSSSELLINILNYEPGKEVSCDGLDNDCDGLVDEDFDTDGDGFTTCGTTVDGLDTVPNEENDYSFDCDDSKGDDPSNCPTSTTGCTEWNSKCAICKFPGAQEFCDSIQTDCTRLVDNDDAVCADLATEYDEDGDGYCKEGTNEMYLNDKRMCSAGTTFDCNDGDSSVSPHANEICDGIDNNCNGLIDEGCDSDKDGYLDAQKECTSSAKCADDAGNARDCLASCDTLDCNDDDPATYPTAPEECTSVEDRNCDEISFSKGREDDACMSTSENTCDYFIDEYGIICKGSKDEGELGYWSDCSCNPYIEIVSPKDGEVFDGVPPVLEIKTNLYSPVNNIPLASYRVSGGPTMTYYQNQPFSVTRAYPDHSMEIQAFFDTEGTSLLGKDLDQDVKVTYIPREEDLGPVKESYVVNATKTSEEDTATLINDLQNSVTASLHSTTSNVTTQDVDAVLKKTISTKVYSGKTEVSLNLNAKKELQGTSVIIEIPKCAASLVQDIQFEDNSFEILKDDPVIAWHFSELSDNLDLKYRFNKELDPECLQQLKVLSLVDEISEDKATDFLSSPLFAILLIPIVAGILIYFSKFVGGNKVDRSVDENNISAEILDVVRARKQQGEDDSEIIADLGNEGFSQRDVKNALKKV